MCLLPSLHYEQRLLSGIVFGDSEDNKRVV